jgi:hypothetical protein
MGIDFVPLPPPLPVGVSTSMSTDDIHAEGGHIESNAEGMMDESEDMPISDKASRMLYSASSKKNMVRRKSLAMMEKLLSKSSGGANAQGILAGPKAVRYSSNFFAQYEDFITSPLLSEDPMSHLYLIPPDDVSVSVEKRDDFQIFPVEDRAVLLKLPEATQQNATWLLEAYKLFTHANYRMVHWKYAEQGGLYNRCSESSAPGAFAYRVVPKEPEKQRRERSASSASASSAGASTASPIFFATASNYSAPSPGNASPVPSVHIPVTISEDEEGEEVKKSPHSGSMPSLALSSGSVGAGSGATTTANSGEGLTPRSLKKEKTESVRSLTPTPKPDTLSTSPVIAGKRGRKKRVASTSVNLKDLNTQIQLSNLTLDFLKKELEIRQHASKVHLFMYYSIRDKTLGINEMPDFSRSHVPHPFEFVGFPQKTHMAIEATGLSLPELPAEEPVFCTLSLHDVAQGLKVSEDFSFELSSVSSLAALDRSIAVCHGGILSTSQAVSKSTAMVANQAQFQLKPNPLNMGNRCLVTVTGDVHSNYYLIVKISRVALPEDQHRSIFSGASSSSSGKRESVQPTNLAPNSIPFFYRVPYAIGAVPIGTSPSSLPTAITTLLPIKSASTYQEMYDLILSEKDLKKLKTIPGQLSLSCSRVVLHENSDIQSKLVNTHLDPYFAVPPKVPDPSNSPVVSTKKDKDKRSKKDKTLKKDKTTGGGSAAAGSTSAFATASLEVSKETGRSGVIKALQELGPQNRDFMNSHVNHLYVLPKRFTLKGGSSKDIQIEIRFKDSDHSPNHTDAGLEVFFGGSHSPRLMDVVVSNVCRSDKHVEFTDEFKMKLPFVLGPQHHLLFTFYEVDMKKQKRTLVGYSVLPLLGADFQLGLNDTVQALQVHPELPNHYMLHLQQMAQAEQSSNKSSTLPFKGSLMGTASIQSDMKKRTFLISTELVSSVYSMNPILSRFFFSYRRFPKKGDATYDSLLEAVSNLPNVENTTIFKHFPLIFNMLISIMCSCVPATYVDDKQEPQQARQTSPPPKRSSKTTTSKDSTQNSAPTSNLVTTADTLLGREAFVALLDLITKVSASTPGKFSSYLRAYLSHMFDNSFFIEEALSTERVGSEKSSKISSEKSSKNGSSPEKYLRSLPYEAIVNQINALHQSGNNYFSGFEHGWFLLGLVVKSMALHLADSKLLDAPRMQRFSVDYTSKLQAMLLTLLSEKNMRAGIDYTQGVAMFLKDLVGLIDRGAVLTILHDYLVMTRKGKSGPILETYKFALLKILGNYEHLTELNVPLAPSGKELTNQEALSSYLATLRERHPVAGELVYETSIHFIDSATASTLNGAISPGAGPTKSPLIRAGTVLGSIPASQLLLELRNQSIIVLRHVLSKHELDPRLQDAKAQQRVASMYFPFLVRVCADPTPLLEMAKSEREEWLICFMYIARNVKRRLLLRWFALESQKVQVNFWTVLEHCLVAFDKITLSRQADLLTVDLVTSVLQELGSEFNSFASSNSSDAHGQANPVLKKMVVLLQQLITKAMTGMTSRGASGSEPSPSASRSVSPSSSGSSLPSNRTAGSGTVPVPLRPPSVSNAAGMPVQDEASIGNLFLPMQLFLERCPLSCFANATTPGELFGMLLYDFLTQCNHLVSPTVRSFGASMLYLLLTQARHVMGEEFMKVKVDMAVAASKLIGTTTNARRRVFAPLLISLSSVKKFAIEQQHLQISQSQGGGGGGSSQGAGKDLKDSKETAKESSKKEWIGKFEEILNHVMKLLEDSSKLEMNVKDPEMMQELYISIEKSFSGSPELRVTWIENLSQLHLENEDFEEAAECRVHIASMVAQYLRSREGAHGGGLMSRHLPSDWMRFPFLSPNLKASEDATISSSAAHISTESSTWHAKYLMDQLKQSAALFDKATRYELSLEVFNNLRQYHKMEKKWDAYEKVIREEQDLLARLVDVNKPLERAFPVYFRVAFYGQKWEHLDGKVFIYKKSTRFNLSTFKKQIEDQYRVRMAQKESANNIDGQPESPREFGSDSAFRGSDASPASESTNTGSAGSSGGAKGETSGSQSNAASSSAGGQAGDRSSVGGLTSLTYNPADAAPPLDLVIMSTNEPVKRDTLDPTKSYVQMTGVQPYFDAEEMDSRVTRTDQHFAIDRFLFETPFTEDGGKESDDLSKQCKKKTIFRTTHSFPYIKTRLEIIETREIVLTPIENAIELIKQQSVKLRGELDSYPTRLKSLQQVIQGSVVPMVNPGPLKICEIFLSEKAFSSKKYSYKDLRNLCNAMNQFVKLCAFAVKLNKANIDASHAKFQAMVEQFHGELEKIVKQCTSQIEKLMETHPEK